MRNEFSMHNSIFRLWAKLGKDKTNEYLTKQTMRKVEKYARINSRTFEDKTKTEAKADK